jgi:Ricin-type beta-trefoil lectin domain/Subtilase family/Putative Ig domain
MRAVLSPLTAAALAGTVALAMLGTAGTSLAASAASSAAASSAAAPSGPGGPSPWRPRAPAVGVLTAPRLPGDERQVCPPPARPGQMACMSVIRLPGSTSTGSAPAAAAAVAGYGPSSLRSAYRLASASARDGRGRTIAIVDAYRNPDAARNLASYRRHFGLRPCTVSSGCLRIVNQQGKARPLPGARVNWGIEEALDLDMVSALCPRCRILLVEATSASIGNLGKAENTAVSEGARFVSNSWSGGEFIGQDAYDRYFNHPGDAIVFASGDFGYGSQYPADTQYVTSVGGTTLRHQHSGRRGWSEQAWGASAGVEGTGSGCSPLEAKPSWQALDRFAPGGCLNRTENDVAADANPDTGAAIYDSYRTGGRWLQVGGTSAATPIITAAYALAGVPTRGTYPAAYPYQHSSRFFDIKSGVNGRCEPNRQYLCHGRSGYDGPTGLGSPDGTGGFSNHGARRVTLADPGTQDLRAGTSVRVQISGFDGRGSARSLAYSATGLPAGLSIARAPRSTGAVITGILPSAPGRFAVTVRGRDRVTGQAGSTRFTLVAAGSLTDAFPGSGQVELDRGGPLNGKCLTDKGDGITAGTPVVITSCGSDPAAQAWSYVPDGRPGGSGILAINNMCLSLSGARSGSGARLESCDGQAGQAWEYLPFGQLLNPASGLCLADPGGSTAQNTQLRISACDNGKAQTWTLAASPIVSGIAGMCLDQPAFDGPVDIAGCDNQARQQWIQEPDGTIQIGPGSCLDVGQSALDGARVAAGGCGPPGDNASQVWLLGPGGELINAFSGKCLADPGNATASGTRLRQEDCYGEPGEIWAVN